MSITFPDNDNRERRAIELMTDCNSSIVRLVSMEADINRKIVQLSDLAQSMIKAKEPGSAGKVTERKLYDTVWKISDIVSSSLVFGIAYKVLSKAVAARIVSNAAAKAAAARAAAAAGEDAGVALGEIGEQTVPLAAKELGIPLTAKVAGAAGGAVLAVGVGFAIDALEGGIARGKLRDTIHENFRLRTKQKLNEQQVQKLQEQVSSHLDSLVMMQKLGYDRARMDKLTIEIIKKFWPEMEQLTETTANEELTSLDLARGSWTNEDT